MQSANTPREVLIIEDNPGDARLIREALSNEERDARFSVARDGVEGIDAIRRRGRFADAPVPDLVILDLNLPKKRGVEVLQEIKGDPALCSIPVVVLTTSTDEEDIRRCYELHANCYVVKHLEFREFVSNVRTIRNFWLNVASLPSTR